MSDQKPTILIVEDDVSLRRMYELAFTINNFTVFTADDGISGLDELRAKKPQIVLLDIMMPNEDGYYVLAAAKQDPSVSPIKTTSQIVKHMLIVFLCSHRCCH